MAKNNKTRFFYVLYSDKTWVFDQSERAYYPIYIIKPNKYLSSLEVLYTFETICHQLTKQPEGNKNSTESER